MNKTQISLFALHMPSAAAASRVVRAGRRQPDSSNAAQRRLCAISLALRLIRATAPKGTKMFAASGMTSRCEAPPSPAFRCDASVSSQAGSCHRARRGVSSGPLAVGRSRELGPRPQTVSCTRLCASSSFLWCVRGLRSRTAVQILVVCSAPTRRVLCVCSLCALLASSCALRALVLCSARARRVLYSTRVSPLTLLNLPSRCAGSSSCSASRAPRAVAIYPPTRACATPFRRTTRLSAIARCRHSFSSWALTGRPSPSRASRCAYTSRASPPTAAPRASPVVARTTAAPTCVQCIASFPRRSPAAACARHAPPQTLSILVNDKRTVHDFGRCGEKASTDYVFSWFLECVMSPKFIGPCPDSDKPVPCSDGQYSILTRPSSGRAAAAAYATRPPPRRFHIGKAVENVTPPFLQAYP